MTRDDIVRMAREAGIEFDPRWGTCSTGNVQLERFAALAAAAEREACAKVCEEIPLPEEATSLTHLPTIERCAAAIRARGET